MVSVVTAYPTYTVLTGFFSSQLNDLIHHQMPKSIVTID
jgi:hypothetical protein